MSAMPDKTCSACGVSKPLAAFHRHPDFRDGRLNRCAMCVSEAGKLARGITPRTLQRLQSQWLLAYGLRRCCGCKQAKPLREFPRNRAQYLGLSTECRRCSTDRYMARPLGERNARTRTWMTAHPDVVLAHARKAASARRARIRGNFVEHVDPRVVYERDQGICGICDEPVSDRFDVDHIVPLAAGGEHSYANSRIAHPACNRAKGREVALAVA